MTALSAGHRPATGVSPLPSTCYQKIINSGSVMYSNAVAAMNTSGQWVPASADATLVVHGFVRLDQGADSLTGDGTKELRVDTGCKTLASTGLVQANEGATGYAVDDQTFSLSSNGGTRPVMGQLMKVRSATSGDVAIDPILSRTLAAATRPAPVLFSVNDFREVDASGDVGAITANGGLLAADTTPILRGDTDKTQEIVWAAGNVDKVMAHATLPPGFDGAQDVTVDLFVRSGGTTDLSSFTVESGWDGAALVSDAATDAAASTTMHKITATIAAADVPAGASVLTLILTPGTHATDTIALLGARVNL